MDMAKEIQKLSKTMQIMSDTYKNIYNSMNYLHNKFNFNIDLENNNVSPFYLLIIKFIFYPSCQFFLFDIMLLIDGETRALTC